MNISTQPALAVAVVLAVASEVKRAASARVKARREAASTLPKAGAKAKPKRLNIALAFPATPSPQKTQPSGNQKSRYTPTPPTASH